MIDVVSELGGLVGYCAGLGGYGIGTVWAFGLEMRRAYNCPFGLLYVLPTTLNTSSQRQALFLRIQCS